MDVADLGQFGFRHLALIACLPFGGGLFLDLGCGQSDLLFGLRQTDLGIFQLRFQLAQAIALAQTQSGGVGRAGAGGETVPAPHRAISADQALAGMQGSPATIGRPR